MIRSNFGFEIAKLLIFKPRFPNLALKFIWFFHDRFGLVSYFWNFCIYSEPRAASVANFFENLSYWTKYVFFSSTLTLLIKMSVKWRSKIFIITVNETVVFKITSGSRGQQLQKTLNLRFLFFFHKKWQIGSEIAQSNWKV